MSVSFVCAIYGINSNSASAGGSTNAQYMSFPSANILVRQAPPITTSFSGSFNTVVVHSVIQLLPGGLVVNQPQYYSDRTVDQINTLRNA